MNQSIVIDEGARPPRRRLPGSKIGNFDMAEAAVLHGLIRAALRPCDCHSAGIESSQSVSRGGSAWLD
jgi:hypothetical protein